MPQSERLAQEIKYLGGVLGEVILEQAGRARYELEESIRLAARARREGSPGAERHLLALIRGLEEEEALAVVRAFTLFFELANLAEDRERVRVLRELERARAPAPRPESVTQAVQIMKTRGLSAVEARALLGRLRLELVLTAHPTEAKRRSVRSRIRKLRHCLAALDDERLLERERERWRAEIEAIVTSLWQTELVRPRRPTVLEEVEVGLYFGRTFFQIVPAILGDLKAVLEREYPGERFAIPPIVTLGSWIAGDRDGNPAVTAEVTRGAFLRMRRAAVEWHLERCRLLVDELTPSARLAQPSEEIAAELARALARYPSVGPLLDPLSPHELYRRMLKVVEWRLEQTGADDPLKAFRQPPGEPARAGAYRRAAELASEVQLVSASLRAHGGGRIAEGELARWIWQIAAFGLHFARLDIRQDSAWNAAVLAEILRSAGLASDYLAMSEEGKRDLLHRTVSWNGAIDIESLAPDARETCELFRLLASIVGSFGGETLGGYVISMTHALSDVLAVLWLSRARALVGNAGHGGLPLSIIPLFETIRDLADAPQILASILDDPAYRAHLDSLGGVQTVMIGYSDSTKDGGYLAACWAIYQAQADLFREAAKRGVRLLFFHGRGGSLGRGGGPAARSILSLPPETLQGGLRMTEQGEVLADRYDDPEIAYRHLEQICWAMITGSVQPPAQPRDEWLAIMRDLADRAHDAYRALVQEPDFMTFFEQATPIAQIESLPIASRPARRHGKRTLGDLRAIPWVFAWTQCRLLLPAWFGIGAAVEGFADLEALRSMYREWPFFRATLDNATLALAKADLPIARAYADLVEDGSLRQRVWARIETEYRRSREAVLSVNGQAELLDEVAWLKESIRVRNPNTDPLNLIQVEWLRRQRESERRGDAEAAERYRELLRLTVEGVAAGMRTTG